MKNRISEIAVIGLSHKTAGVETRELFSVPKSRQSDIYSLIRSCEIEESVYISTCNRVEIYISSKDIHRCIARLMDRLRSFTKISPEEFQTSFYIKHNRDAVTHLLAVVSSLDSMVIGENEIASQVKDAYKSAVENGFTGPFLNRLFHQAFKTSKKIKSQTDISRNPTSVAYIATEQAKKIFPDLSVRKALLIGAGEMGELILKYMTKFNIGGIVIANRSLSRARIIADEINAGATIIPLDDIELAAIEVDIIITSVSAPHHIITASMAEEIMNKRNGRPLFIIDIAVPRNIDPMANGIQSLHLFNVDNLQEIANENLKSRMKEMELAREIVESDVDEFYEWQKSFRVAPTIEKIQSRFDEIRLMELHKFRKKKLKHISDEDFALIEELTRQIMTRTLHNPIVKLKEHHSTVPHGEHHESLYESTKFFEELFIK